MGKDTERSQSCVNQGDGERTQNGVINKKGPAGSEEESRMDI